MPPKMNATAEKLAQRYANPWESIPEGTPLSYEELLRLAEQTLNYALMNPTSRDTIADRLKQECTPTQHLPGLAIAHTLGGFRASAVTNYTQGRQELAQALAYFAQVPRTLGHALASGLAGMMESTQGNFEEALQHHLYALRLLEDYPSPNEAAFVRYCAGSFYVDVAQPDLALSFFEEGILLGEQHRYFRLPLARCLNGAGAIYISRGEYAKGIELELQAMALYQETNIENGVGRCLHDIGMAYLQMGDAALGRKYLTDALAIRRELTNAEGLITTLIALSDLDTAEGHTAAARTALEEALEKARHLGNRPKQTQALRRLADCCEATGQTAQALAYFKEYHTLHEQTFRFELDLQIRQLETEKEAELQRVRNVELAGVNGNLNKALGNIHESIAYAQQIQLALLPTPEQLRTALPESMLVFRPRDSVSGDFYWLAQRDGAVYIAVGDCTGHGVPGALLSMLAISLLNEALKNPEVDCPAKILDFIDRGLRNRLSGSQLQDGLEAAVMVLHPAQGCLYYAGAGMPLYFSPGPGQPLEIIPAHKGTLGSRQVPIGHFDPTEIRVQQPGTATFFAASDGYRDQFGAETGGRLQRLGSRRFQYLLAAAAALPPTAAEALLTTELDTWRGTQAQVDDILVLGFRV